MRKINKGRNQKAFQPKTSPTILSSNAFLSNNCLLCDVGQVDEDFF